MTISVLFFGTPHFSVPTLQALLDMEIVKVGAVVTQPDRPAGRGNRLRITPIKELALSRQLPVLQPESIRKSAAQFISQVKEYGAFDIGVVIAFGQILPKVILETPAHGCINVHASLLPRWRGAAPIQRAIEAGDSKTGVGLMHMEQGLDTGAVYVEEEIPIQPTDTSGSLHEVLAGCGAQLVKKHLEAIVKGTLRPQPQSEEGVTYAQKISTAEAKIDWSCSVQKIDRKVRALNPLPAAFTFYENLRLKVFELIPAAERAAQYAKPGEIISVASDRLEIACGNGSLLLRDLQVEGRKRMSVTEFLRGTKISPGICLGS